MEIPINNLVYLNDQNLFRAIVSSADRFPGLYRKSATWDQSLNEDRYLKWINYLEVILLSQKGRVWTKAQWLAAHDHIFSLAYGKNSRNENREENDIKDVLKQKAFKWYTKPMALRLAIIDFQSEVYTIECNKTYYMMGSLIRFTEHSVKIAYDQFADSCYLELAISYSQAIEYINSIYSPKSLNDLFLKSEVVGHLIFTEEGNGNLHFKENIIDEIFLNFQPNSPLFGSVIYDKNLPIQYGKPIGICNVGKLFS